MRFVPLWVKPGEASSIQQLLRRLLNFRVGPGLELKTHGDNMTLVVTPQKKPRPYQPRFIKLTGSASKADGQWYYAFTECELDGTAIDGARVGYADSDSGALNTMEVNNTSTSFTNGLDTSDKGEATSMTIQPVTRKENPIVQLHIDADDQAWFTLVNPITIEC